MGSPLEDDDEPWLRSYSDARQQAERDRIARLVEQVMQQGSARPDIASAIRTWAAICANLRKPYGSP